MKTAVCMKYVPVIARMRFDYEARTIIREGVPSEVNPFDVLGLVRAVELRTAPEDEVVVLTMGPPRRRRRADGVLGAGRRPGRAGHRPRLGRQRYAGDLPRPGAGP